MSDTQKLEQELHELALQVAALLEARDQKVAFAESCTGGKMAAAMTGVPGISSFFCGSAVTYREATKTSWLSIDEGDLKEHTAESEFITASMAKEVLRKTPEANLAVAITGHLGPGVDQEIDGVVFVAVAGRSNDKLFLKDQGKLQSDNRLQRQTEAACFGLRTLIVAIEAN